MCLPFPRANERIMDETNIHIYIHDISIYGVDEVTLFAAGVLWVSKMYTIETLLFCKSDLPICITGSYEEILLLQ